MIELDIEYVNFDQKTVVDKYWFNLSYDELAELEAEAQVDGEGGFEQKFKLLLAKNDGSAVLELLRSLTMKAVGLRTGEGGRRFSKTDDIRLEFQETGAYSALFVQLLTGKIDASAFFNGIMPGDLKSRAADMKQRDAQQKEIDATTHAASKQITDYTLDELLHLTDSEFKALAILHNNNLPKTFLVAGMQRATR